MTQSTSDTRRPTIPFFGQFSRQEAATFHWQQLTELQQNAVLNCHRRLREIATVTDEQSTSVSNPRTGAARFLPKVDASRKNNAILIDGRRGSGKTIVLFTLLRYWIAQQERFRKLLPDPDSAKVLRDRIAHELHFPPDTSPASIVPIGPIDLQYLSPATQIIPLIADAFHEVVQGLREARGGERTDTPPWMTLSADTTNVSERWREFVSSAAAWEANSAHRQGHLDPEEYVVEVSVMEAERSKLQGRFRAFADAMVSEYSATFGPDGSEPLFVLCIDDADMKPTVSVRLLEALRVLYHPRVAFLLTGDSELFVNMLTDNFFAGIRWPLKRLELSGDKLDEVSDRSFALRLASEVYGKVIPTAHRIEVPRIPPEERARMLRDVLERVRDYTPVDVAIALREGHMSEDPSRNQLENPPIDHYLALNRYTANALPEQLREMLAFRDFVRDHIERAQAGLAEEEPHLEESPDNVVHHTSLTIRVVQHLWIEALEDSLLSRDIVDILRNVVRYDTRPHFRFFVDNSSLTKNTLSVPLHNLRFSDGSTISLRRIVGYEMYVSNGDKRVLLSEAAEGALILATDLAADYVTGDFVAASLSPDEFDNPFVTVGLPIIEGTLDVVWPLPDWDSFIDFHIFSDRWQLVVARYSLRRRKLSPNELTTILAKRFLALVLEVINEERRAPEPQRGELGSESPNEPNAEQLTWSDLARQIAVVAFGRRDKSRSRDIVNSRWALSRAILIGAPESNLVRKEAEEFLDAIRAEFTRRIDEQPEEDRYLLARWLEDIQNARLTRLSRSYVHGGKERGNVLSQSRSEQLARDLATAKEPWSNFIKGLEKQAGVNKRARHPRFVTRQ